MLWLWLALGLIVTAGLAFAGVLLWYYIRVKNRYLPYIVRIFEEKPLFIIPRGEPLKDAENVRLTTPDGLTLHGCYLRTPLANRKGVILFGLEYGSNRWACVPYTHFLRAAGFDIFAFEPRGQGDSDDQPGYEPMQWVTEFEVSDFKTALAYLKTRPDTDPRGIGFFGISKGGSAGIIAAGPDPFVRCFLTDGIFATHTTMLPYIRKWATIYVDRFWVHWILPDWMYSAIARACLRRIRRDRGLRFPHLEHVIPYLAPRPLLMIHGGADTYIKPDMAKTLFDLAGEPREFWLVQGAKHNQAMNLVNGEYQRRVLDFFQRNLGNGSPLSEGASSAAWANQRPPKTCELAGISAV
ncbi:MAG TPA: prolyl oligopeptidase family serine peptidase [Gemmataceae bacterium]|nr:prolyl oligopeptidase family serine peptidase [Gemmataceae bacterium]